MLDKRLHYPASIVFVNQVLELIPDDVNGLLDDLVLILIRLLQLLLLHEQLVVVNPKSLNQLGYLLLLSPVLGVCLVTRATFGSVFAAASRFSISIRVDLLLVAGAMATGLERPLISCLLASGSLLVAAVLLAAGIKSEINRSWDFRGPRLPLGALVVGQRFIACFYFSLLIWAVHGVYVLI